MLDDTVLQPLLAGMEADIDAILPVADYVEECGYFHVAGCIRGLRRRRWDIIGKVKSIAKERKWPYDRCTQLMRHGPATRLVNRVLDGGRLMNYDCRCLEIAQLAIKAALMSRVGIVRYWLERADSMEKAHDERRNKGSDTAEGRDIEATADGGQD